MTLRLPTAIGISGIAFCLHLFGTTFPFWCASGSSRFPQKLGFGFSPTRFCFLHSVPPCFKVLPFSVSQCLRGGCSSCRRLTAARSQRSLTLKKILVIY